MSGRYVSYFGQASPTCKVRVWEIAILECNVLEWPRGLQVGTQLKSIRVVEILLQIVTGSWHYIGSFIFRFAFCRSLESSWGISPSEDRGLFSWAATNDQAYIYPTNCSYNLSCHNHDKPCQSVTWNQGVQPSKPVKQERKHTTLEKRGKIKLRKLNTRAAASLVFFSSFARDESIVFLMCLVRRTKSRYTK